MKYILYIFLITICYNCKEFTSDSKNEDKKDFRCGLEELVLKERKKGEIYFLKEPISDDGVLEFKLAYLGNVQSKKMDLMFLLTTTYTGLYQDSKRASSNIVLYTNNLERLGQYYISGDFQELPIIENNNLIFTNKLNYCNQTTQISFKDSIPQEIFIHCKEENGQMFGDVYSFEKRKKKKQK